ncbi:transketolase [Anaerosolibacter carboniphilus]|uniref:Transketolase n=1 Tax=Anaerosolibacter carboniphilus TaxID=1417629 RepID=A0A841KPW1_9FIRM|nr:transketolase [Anaerosolibacter carboniphilus]MBB6215371.1 transketolase [Anaerosolibacter carboniphilus]
MSDLKKLSTKIRLEVCKMLKHRGFGHLGGSLSIIETLSVLYGDVMKINPQNPNWEERDWFILSKGHAGPALYATLAVKGYFPLEMLNTLNNNDTRIPSHPDRLKTPGVDVTTGSLGQGISLAVGIAKSFQISQKPNRVYTIVGDGECNEGQVWEAFQFAAHHKLSNLIIFIDENHKQLDGPTKDIINSFDMKEKVEAFGFAVKRISGNDELAIKNAVLEMFEVKDKACCIILDTIKGQGIKYYEMLSDNHHIRFSGESEFQLDLAIEKLKEELEREGR